MSSSTMIASMERVIATAQFKPFDTINGEIMNIMSNEFTQFEQYMQVVLVRIRRPDTTIINLQYKYPYQNLADAKYALHEELKEIVNICEDLKKRTPLYEELADTLYHQYRIARTIAGDPDWEGLFE